MVDMCDNRKKAKGEVRAQSLFDALLTCQLELQKVLLPPTFLSEHGSKYHVIKRCQGGRAVLELDCIVKARWQVTHQKDSWLLETL